MAYLALLAMGRALWSLSPGEGGCGRGGGGGREVAVNVAVAVAANGVVDANGVAEQRGLCTACAMRAGVTLSCIRVRHTDFRGEIPYSTLGTSVCTHQKDHSKTFICIHTGRSKVVKYLSLHCTRTHSASTTLQSSVAALALGGGFIHRSCVPCGSSGTMVPLMRSMYGRQRSHLSLSVCSFSLNVLLLLILLVSLLL